VSIDYPSHLPRAQDPHFKAFERYRSQTEETATCWWSDQTGDASKCSDNLELHHGVIEFSLVNSVDPKLLDKEFPDAGSSLNQIDEWVNSSSESLIWLCMKHHRGHGAGIHVVSYALWKSSLVAPSVLE